MPTTPNTQVTVAIHQDQLRISFTETTADSGPGVDTKVTRYWDLPIQVALELAGGLCAHAAEVMKLLAKRAKVPQPARVGTNGQDTQSQVVKDPTAAG